MINSTYSTALLLVAAILVLAAITPQIVPHTRFAELGNKATAATCVRQMPQYRPNPGNKC
jgi:hypothetical protein